LIRETIIRSNPLSAWLATADERSEHRVIGVVFGILLVGFWATVSGLPGTWNASYQEHGFFVGALTAWLVWHHRRRMLDAVGPGWSDLMPVVGLLSFTWLLAVIMNVRLVQQLLLLLTLVTWALVVFGKGARRTIVSIAATFLLAIPIWSLAVPVLQRATVIASAGATQMAGITAEIGLYTITLTTGTFLIEEGCAGLNYLMGGLTLGAFYAHLFTDRWQTQLKIVGVAGLASIVGNWIRVTFLVFLGEATAMQSPMLEDHLWQGWAIFTLLMIPTYFVMRRIERRDAVRSARSTEIEAADVPADIAADTTAEVAAAKVAEGAPLESAIERTNGRAAIAVRAASVALVGPILLTGVGLMPRASEPEPDVDVFDVHPAWSSERVAGGWTPDFGGIDDQADWKIPVGVGNVEAARYYFRDQRQGEELIGYPNAIAPDMLIVADRIIGPIGADRRLVNEVVFVEDGNPRIAWYWYRVAGFETPFASKAKLLEILAFFRRSPSAELIVMSMKCMPESCGDAAMALRAVASGPEVPEPVATRQPER
jgi:exosortase